MRRWLLCFTGISGLVGVAGMAIAAHGLPDPQAQAWAQQAGQLQTVHAAAALAIMVSPHAGKRLPLAIVCAWLLGTLLFCGSLYALAAGAPRDFAMLAPWGGLSFLVGWLMVAVLAFTKISKDQP